MIAGDFVEFAHALALVAETFGVSVSPAQIEIYFRALSDLPFEQVRAAMDAACRQLRFFPKPVELRELLEGSSEELGELAWTRVRTAFERGLGGYRPIDFGDPILHAAIEAMGGWDRFHYLGFRGVEEVEIVTTRKEFLAVYSTYRKKGAPAWTPVALCASPEPVFPEPRKLGDGFVEPMVPALPAATVAPAALAGLKEQIAPELVHELFNDLASHHQSPAPKRQLERPTAPAKSGSRAALTVVPSAAELANHELKKAVALSKVKAAIEQTDAPAEVVHASTEQARIERAIG